MNDALHLSDWLAQVLPLLLCRATKRVDGVVIEGDVSAYWAGSVLRIDLKPEAS